MIEVFLEDDEVNLILQNLEVMRANVEPGLGPMMYWTMTYEGDVKIKQRADAIAEKLGAKPVRSVYSRQEYVTRLKTALQIFDEPHQNYIPSLDCTIAELLAEDAKEGP